MLEGFSSVSCIDKLYGSMNELSSDRQIFKLRGTQS